MSVKLPTKEDILQRTSLFGNVSPKNLSALAEICLAKSIRKNQTLFLEGDKASYVFILVTGNIRLSKSGPDGRNIVIKVVKPGEIFAEVVLFEKDRYPVNAVALATSALYQIPRRQFTCLLNDEDFRADFMANLMGKLRYLTVQIQYLTSHDVEDRLFLFLEEQHGRENKIRCSLSKKQIASAIGTTPETLSRLLNRLKKNGTMSWGKDLITIGEGVWENRAES